MAIAACSGSDGDAPDAAAAIAPYAEVEAILARSCAFERCHSGALVGAGLALPRGGDYHAALVGRTACEYERMALVEPGDPDRSWLMVKLTAPFRDRDDPYPFYIEFTPDEDWEEGDRGCPDETEDGVPLFGQRMPLTAPNMLPEEELQVLREWIEGGAKR